jgi:hypothetical protein
MVVIPKGQPVIDISSEMRQYYDSMIHTQKLIHTQRLINGTVCNMLRPRGFDLLAYICLATCNRIPDQKWYSIMNFEQMTWGIPLHVEEHHGWEVEVNQIRKM